MKRAQAEDANRTREEAEEKRRQRALYGADGLLKPHAYDTGGDEAGLFASRERDRREAGWARAAAATEAEHAEFGAAPPPIELCLDAGELGLMDVRALHFGGAHTAPGRGVERVLFNATFALDAETDDGGERHAGFTYHRHGDMGQTLGSFLRTSG